MTHDEMIQWLHDYAEGPMAHNPELADVCNTLTAIRVELERLQSRNDFLAQQVVELGHEVTRLRTTLFEAQQAILREGMEANRLLTEIDQMRPELIRLRLENSRLLTCGGVAEYAVPQRSDCRPDERDMIWTPPTS